MIGLNTAVCRRVRDQTLSMGERFVALITLVWFLPGMHSFVHFKLTLIQEARTTIVAQMALLSRMLDHVGI